MVAVGFDHAGACHRDSAEGIRRVVLVVADLENDVVELGYVEDHPLVVDGARRPSLADEDRLAATVTRNSMIGTDRNLAIGTGEAG